MSERLNVIIRKENYPELYAYLLEEKGEHSSYVALLDQLVKENQRLRKENIKQNDWTGMRLPLRATEKTLI